MRIGIHDPHSRADRTLLADPDPLQRNHLRAVGHPGPRADRDAGIPAARGQINRRARHPRLAVAQHCVLSDSQVTPPAKNHPRPEPHPRSHLHAPARAPRVKVKSHHPPRRFQIVRFHNPSRECRSFRSTASRGGQHAATAMVLAQLIIFLEPSHEPFYTLAQGNPRTKSGKALKILDIGTRRKRVTGLHRQEVLARPAAQRPLQSVNKLHQAHRTTGSHVEHAMPLRPPHRHPPQPFDGVVDIDKIAPHPAVVENVDALPRQDGAREAVTAPCPAFPTARRP